MSLLSLEFAEFVAIAALLYHVCPRQHRPILLSATSILFCALNSIASAIALTAATAITFILGRRIDNAVSSSARRKWLALGLLLLLVHLLSIKLTASFSSLSGAWLANVLAAFGASYYTFKLAGYLIDVYWRRYPAWSNPVGFASFSMFFPLLPAGPIQRASEFREPGDNAEIAKLMGYGLRRILLGLAKKLLVADRLGGLVDYIAQNHGTSHANALWIMAYLFPLQLYADFSALTDIAIGVACLFGIRPPENFNFPYFAYSISEFWRRWHMSLTRWLGDYVFLPLRMATRTWGTFGLIASIFVNMVLIATWHAVTLGWLLFGVMNATFLIVDALTLKARTRLYKRKPAVAEIAKITGPLLVYHLIAISLVCFRAQSLADIGNYFGHLFGGAGAPLASLKQLFYSYGRGPCAYDFCALCAFALLETGLYLRSRNWKPLSRLPTFDAMPSTARWAMYYLAVLGIGIASQESSRFIYVQF